MSTRNTDDAGQRTDASKLALINFLTRGVVRASKHASGRRGQKAAAKRHARGGHGKAVRRRALARTRRSQSSKRATLEARREP